MAKKLNITQMTDDKGIVTATINHPTKEVDLSVQEPTLSELETRAKSIKAKAQEIDTALENAGENKEALKAAILQEVGLAADDDTVMKQGWAPSKIIEEAGIYVIDQEIQKTFASYDSRISSLVKWKVRENGAVQFFYQDYTPVDKTSGYSDVVIGDFNQGRNPITYEWTAAYFEMHKGYDILDTMLNDITKSTGLFVSLMQDLALNIARPIARAMFQFTCQLLANPFIPAFDLAPLDVSTVAADIEISAADFKEAVEKINQAVGVNSPLFYSSRKHRTKNTKWLPTGFTTDLEITPTVGETKILIDSAIDYAISNEVGANTFQLEELKRGLIWTPISFERTFEEIGQVTGLNHTADKFDLLVVYGEPVEGIIHYNAAKNVDTPKLKSVTHTYTRLGHAVNKKYFVLKVTVTIGTPSSVK